MSSVSSEDSLCRGRKEGCPQPTSWGLSGCGVKRAHPSETSLAARCAANTHDSGKDVLDPHCEPSPGPSYVP